MRKQYKLLVLSVVLAVTGGCASVQEQPAEQSIQLNDYPTRDRVEYVLSCIAQHGGLNYINQYACGCKIDKIAEQMSFAEYDTAKTFSNLRSVPGESGAAFRDPKQSKDLKKKLKEAEASAEKSCFVK
ncbi:conserved exported hypothetical protein [Crenothrix polyspora]|jgi:hypothetical protein|uniref:Lipoprotein n=1 Tax=Crenothrix polyspora TaxID=360316 RepID=A0A1R4HIY5_9GAMM|nr:hypothetical protein [Crenothrix polyspora]SJM96192.1 conserved exported hypothetical protein [Crenothrix polyspora]